MNKKQNAVPTGRQGFSLVELLVVISIIAVLTAIVLPNFMGAREKAKDSQRIQDLNSIKNSLRMYYNDYQAYPTPGIGAGVPGDPIGAGFSGYFPAISGLGFTYGYATTNGTDGFILCQKLETSGGPEAINSQGKCNVSAVGTSLGIGFCDQAIGVTGAGVYTVCAN
jgi:prepilin-type N-terminal cleavage/methylation domain-containing protein